jgi:hypothetical protein
MKRGARVAGTSSETTCFVSAGLAPIAVPVPRQSTISNSQQNQLRKWITSVLRRFELFRHERT